jgi:hypothetical protein
MMLRKIINNSEPIERCKLWFQVILILQADRSANSSFSVVSCHFHEKNAYLEELLENGISNFFNTECYHRTGF